MPTRGLWGPAGGLCWLVGWSVGWLVSPSLADSKEHATYGNWPCLPSKQFTTIRNFGSILNNSFHLASCWGISSKALKHILTLPYLALINLVNISLIDETPVRQVVWGTEQSVRKSLSASQCSISDWFSVHLKLYTLEKIPKLWFFMYSRDFLVKILAWWLKQKYNGKWVASRIDIFSHTNWRLSEKRNIND